ncbi:MAG TPA: aliphatic sulfonate ABC transporter substrate-binding protein [Polyangia bacterium]|nr:aliphatic sulfonate ABC transporter substrate-binding protein [Polyangia bacterium]
MAVLTLPNPDALTVRAKALVFEDPLSRALLERIQQIAPSDATALIVGETGTGKEIVARHLHELGPRRARPFVAVNCGALSETLMESELFGHERGAFTGAIATRPGWFESANGGTLFLDEIGDLPTGMQVKLLRVLQEREVVRVGGRTPIPIDLRLVAATNVHLEASVRAGKFREDLYYRLNVAMLSLPSLRERPGDILPLAHYFLDLYRHRLRAGEVVLVDAAKERLLAHSWPGNIRELENVIHCALLVCRDGRVVPDDLRVGGTPLRPARDSAPAQDRWNVLEDAVRALFDEETEGLHLRIEQIVMRTAYDHCHRNQLQTARLLGISRNVVRARLLESGDLRPAVRRETSVLADGPPASVPGQVADPRPAVRIGYQQFGLLWLLRACGGLERAISESGFALRWTEFSSGPELVEALRSDDLDLGVVGEAPPLVAQAAHTPLVYLAAEPPAPEAEAIIVPRDSTLTRVADLRGERVAVTHGSNAHYLLLRALDEAGVPVAAVDVVFSTPAEARRQFESGLVRAWVIWDPLLASIQHDTGARVLRDATGLASNHAFYVGSNGFTAKRPGLVDAFLTEVGKLGRTANDNPEAVVELLGDSVGISKPALLAALRRNRFGVKPFDAELTRSQQGVADLSLRARLIARPVSVADARWRRAPQGVALSSR